ncbi:MAG: Fur family transcriptional regulator [Candidatus Omnitrophota bacterium]
MPRGCRRRESWWCGRFQGYGYKLTLSRQAILEVLSKTAEHLSADEIYLQARKLYPQAGLSSVYRTLELLVNLGIVCKLDFGDGKYRYELVMGPKEKGHHHHLVCTACGKVVDYTEFIEDEIELLRKTEKGLSKKYGFNITDHTIQFYGLCDKCQLVKGREK